MAKTIPMHLLDKIAGILFEKNSPSSTNFINQAGIPQFIIINMNEQGVSLTESLSSLYLLHEPFSSAKTQLRVGWSEDF